MQFSTTNFSMHRPEDPSDSIIETMLASQSIIGAFQNWIRLPAKALRPTVHCAIADRTAFVVQDMPYHK